MFGKHIAATLTATLLATSAMAQTPSATPAPATSSTSATSTAVSSSSYQGNWRTSKVVGLNVYNDNDESLGAINDLLTDKQGKIVAVVIGVGGFLGVGERYAAIPFEKIKFVNEPRASSATSSSATPGLRPATSTGSGSATGTGMTGTGMTGSSGTGTTTGSANSGTAGSTTTTTMTPAAPATSTSAQNPWYPDHAVLSIGKDELRNMAEFKYNNS